VDRELTPYLAEQLAEHPRFKGETIALVRLEGPDIMPEIDGLTSTLRDQIRDGLLATTPGVRLPWEPRQLPEQHHRRLDAVQCRRMREASYFVGIEIKQTIGGRYRVSVRALDVDAEEWVGGFGKSWTGSLTASEVRVLHETRTDESLRGLRVLPFDTGQPDLAAAYLANNLSCLLRQQDEQDLVLYVESPPSDQAGLRTLLGLIGNNLSRYSEVRVTDSRKEANFTLRGDAHTIQPGLFQVWVALHPKGSGKHLAGIDTATYISVAPASVSTRDKPVNAARHHDEPPPPPSIIRLEPARAADGSWPATACRQDAAGKDRAAPAPGDCRALEMSVADAGEVFLFVHGAKGMFSRLYPGSCRHSVIRAGDAGAQHYTQGIPVYLTAGPDWRTVYAIAVRGRELEQRLGSLLQDLPDACGETPGVYMPEERRARWLDELDHLIAHNDDRVAWRAKRLP
jgi:hypothetical protein